MSNLPNDGAKKKQRRTLALILLVLGIASAIGAYSIGGTKKTTPIPSAGNAPKLSNVLTPGASVGDKEGWRAEEGAKIAGLSKEIVELKQMLKAIPSNTSRENALKPTDVGTNNVQLGKAIEPTIINPMPKGNLPTPGITQGGVINGGQGTNVQTNPITYPPSTPNAPQMFGKPGMGATGTANGQMMPQQSQTPKSRIVRLLVDAQDNDDGKSSSNGLVGGINSQGTSGTNNEKRLPLFDASKMSLGSSPDDGSPTEKVTYQNKVVKETKNTDNYLPGGSFVEGFLLNGMDAPSGGQAQNNPVPVLIALSSNAYLPSKMRSEVKDCFVVGNGYGDISSERAYIRTESISCVKHDGTAIDMPIKGYITGEDGKAGVRGRLISKQGQILANALTAGLISGLGSAMQATATTTTVNPLGGTTQTPTPGEEAKAGFGGAFGKSMDRLAQYYINLADKTFPVIEIDARRKVTVVISKGTFIDNRVLPKEGTMTDFKNLLTLPK